MRFLNFIRSLFIKEKSFELSSDESRRIVKKSDEVIKSKQLFSQSQLTLDCVAREVGTNRTYLSKAVNSIKRESFPCYINSLRVDFAKEIIERDPTMGVEDYAIACGFGSRRNFVKNFKEREGITPSQYKRHVSVTKKLKSD